MPLIPYEATNFPATAKNEFIGAADGATSDTLYRSGSSCERPSMSELSQLVASFMTAIGNNPTEIYNEFSLQHELGIFLRSELPEYKVQFERNVKDFAQYSADFTKREIDIVVFSRDGRELKYAIELKFPRKGQYPEQMFSFCKDIAFAEELKSVGFSRTALLAVVDDHLFYSGSSEGIYGLFRGSRPVTGRIDKPTGSKNEHVVIKGSYSVSWSPVAAQMRYALVEVGDDQLISNGGDGS